MLQLFPNEGNAQKKVSFQLENVTIKQVFKEIKNQTNFKFLYRNSIVNTRNKVSIRANNETTEVILNRLFKNTAISFEIIDKQIVLTKKVATTLMTTQQNQISGTVTDEDGQPLPGASIVEKGTTNGTQTDFDGNFSLETGNDNVVLVVSYIGFITQEIAVDGQTNLNIALQEDTSELDEVVIVGFGVQKKANLTGATAFVDLEDVLGGRPVTNVLTAIQGTIPGLQITSGSGQPGAGVGINIRGITSINGGGPLILLNNVPVNIEDINPQDVKSVTVLKDASATAIYGARAAFGVVLITTKTPEENQPIKFVYSSTFSLQSPEDLVQKASTHDFVNALKDWGVNSYWTGQDIESWAGFLDEYEATPSTYPQGYAELNGLRYPLANTDVIGEWLNSQGITQIHNFNFSGATDKTRYRVSAGYSNEDGIIITDNDSFKKFNVNTSLTTELSSKFTSTTNIVYRNSTRKTPLGSYSSSISFGAFVPASGDFVFDDGTEVPYDSPANREKLKVAPEILNDNIRFFQKLDYSLAKGLNIIGEYTFTKSNRTRTTSDNQLLTVNPERFTLNATDPVNTFFRKENTQTNYNAFNFYSKYNLGINKHNFSVLAGINNEESSFETFDARRSNLINVDLPSLSGATGTQTTDDSYGEWAVLGYFGRLNYNFDEKYFLEVSGRYDGSSRFPEDSRYGFFPSFSAGWHLGRESFMESINFLSSLKLRGSWGKVGNQVILDSDNNQILYPSVPGLGITDYADTGASNWLNEQTGTRYSTLALPNLVSANFTWETVQTLNLGLDASFLKNRLNVNFDWFKRKTLDMLAPGAKLPAALGANAPLENVADLESTGWDLGLSWNDKIGAFKYNIGATLSDNHATITKFDNPAGLLSDNQNYVGREFGEIWGYTTDGYYAVEDFVDGTLNDDLTGGTLKDGIPVWEGRSQNPGDIKFIDQNGDGVINDGNNTLEDSGDKSIIANSSRRYQYGVYGDFSYKNFDFSFLANGVGKRDVYLNSPVRFPYVNEFAVVYQSQLDYWTPDNTTAFFPRNYALGGVNYDISRSTQTKYLVNGAYFRMRNMTLGYSIAPGVLKRNKIDKIRLFIAAENLFSINDYPNGINPELENLGSGGVYPYLKSYSIGLNLTF